MQVLKSVDLVKTQIDVTEVAIHSDMEHEQISVYMESHVRSESYSSRAIWKEGLSCGALTIGYAVACRGFNPFPKTGLFRGLSAARLWLTRIREPWFRTRRMSHPRKCIHASAGLEVAEHLTQRRSLIAACYSDVRASFLSQWRAPKAQVLHTVCRALHRAGSSSQCVLALL